MNSRVTVSGLTTDCRVADLEKFFKGYGRIQEIKIKNYRASVEFKDPRDADDAVFELNGRKLHGKTVLICYELKKDRSGSSRYDSRRRPGWMDKYGPPTRTENRLIVENLSSRVSWQDLKDFMRQAGEVTYADAHKRRKNEGVVEFSTYSDMRNAQKKLDNTELSGRRIKLVLDCPVRSSRRSRSRTNSRSRSRSSSRSRSPRHSRSRDRSVSKSRSRSPVKRELRSPSRSDSRSGSRDRSASRSPSPGGKNYKD